MERGSFRIDISRRFDERAKQWAWAALKKPGALSDITKHFPSIGNENFVDHVGKRSQDGDMAVFEFGGGPQQNAALELLSQFRIGKYIAFDAQAIKEEAGEKLSNYSQYAFVQGGVVDLDPDRIGRGTYHVVFAHDVALYVPDPLMLLEKMHDIAKKDGVIFMNGVIVREKIANELEERWKSEGQQFSIRRGLIADTYNSGLTELNISLLKTQDTLAVPPPSGSHLTSNNFTYTTLDYLGIEEVSKDPSSHDMYVKYLVAKGIIGKGDQEAAEPVMKIFEAISHGEQLLHQ